MSVRLGKKIVYLSAVALLVAACAKDENKPSATTETPQTTVESGDTGQPNAVDNTEVTSDELSVWKGSDEGGLVAYAGSDRVFFEYDSSELTAHARDVLGKQADWLKHYPQVKVTVEGHCDERGTREYNLALGERRATAVKNYLVALGVPASRVNTISYGKERPAVVGNGESSWSQNRRGVMVVQ